MNKQTGSACILLAIATSAPAANVLLNGSFETSTPALSPLDDTTAWGDTAAGAGVSDWTVTGTAGQPALANGDSGLDGGPYYTGNGSTIPHALPTDGNTFLGTNSEGTMVLSQLVSGLSAGTINVSYDWINQAHPSAGDGTGGPVRVEIFDGNSEAAAVLWDNTASNARADRNTWNAVTSGALSNTGTDLFVRLTVTDSNVAGQTGVDNLVVDFAPVPEPSSAALLGLGGLALILRRRK